MNPKSDEPQSKDVTSMLAGLLSSGGLIIFLLFLFACGIMVGGTALHDPDTCWLVATGRYIFEHGQIPAGDPFSYTFALLDRHWIVYQWLTETCFFAAVKVGGMTALVGLVSLLVTLAYVVIPLRACARSGTQFAGAIFIVALSMLASNFHFLARPEIFSYLFASLSLTVFTFHRLRSEKPVDWKVVASLAAIMIVWVNFHTGFVAAFVVYSLYCLVSLIAGLVLGVKPLFDRTAWLSLIACGCASLVNPYGIGLWKYIPELFYARFNPMIAELKPVTTLGVVALPFLLLVGILFVTWLRRFLPAAKQWQTPAGKVEMTSLAASLAIIVVVSMEACKHGRVIPFAVQALVYEYIFLCAPLNIGLKKGAVDEAAGLKQALQEKLNNGIVPGLGVGSLSFGAFALALAIGGPLLTCFSIQRPVLPQSGKAFFAPLAAMDQLSSLSHAHPGNLFNDAQYGDCLIWYHPSEPKVFIDTRYDMYGETFINDYLQIMSGGDKAIELLRQYKIKYVFAREDSQIIKLLSNMPYAKELAAEKGAILMQVDEVVGVGVGVH